MSLMFPKPGKRKKSQRRDGITDTDYLAHLATQPCLITGLLGHTDESVIAAHLRFSGSGGMSLKPEDCHAVPLSQMMHLKQHSMSEAKFWRTYAPDHLIAEAFTALAEKMYREYKESR